MESAGREFRVTTDLDIVLSAEAQSSEFLRAFWEFVHAGEYEIHEKSTGEKQFYRFKKPKADGYPRELELFSRLPDALEHDGAGPFTPLPNEADLSSLSAILLDSGYYEFLQNGRQITNGVSVVGPVHLIPLKARAWLDMTKRKAEGDRIDAKKIRKHKLDVFRLYAIIDPEFDAELMPQIREDMGEFIDRMAEEDIDLKVIGLANQQLPVVLEDLSRMYGPE